MSLVRDCSNPLNAFPKLVDGAVPLDGGNLTFTNEQKIEFLKIEPNAEKWLRPFITAQTLIRGNNRWVLSLQDIEPHELKKLPETMKRVEATRKYRLSCKRLATKKLAETPTSFAWGVRPKKPFLVIPRVTSENRKYIPISYLEPPAISSNATLVVKNANVGLFGLLTSNMHMVWLKIIGGKLKSDYRYSAGLVYNTFPVPDDYSSLKKYAQTILDIRDYHYQKGSILADLYDSLTMPADLRKAHDQLDKAVEKLYRKEPFIDNMDIFQFLSIKYNEMITKK